jgi:hypothetical protein
MRNSQLRTVWAAVWPLLLLSCNAWAEEGGFPFMLPKERPDRKLSAAMERNYIAYMAPRPEDNELYSLFKYTKLKGLDYSNHDGTITRRDPSILTGTPHIRNWGGRESTPQLRQTTAL